MIALAVVALVGLVVGSAVGAAVAFAVVSVGPPAAFADVEAEASAVAPPATLASAVVASATSVSVVSHELRVGPSETTDLNSTVVPTSIVTAPPSLSIGSPTPSPD